MSSYGIILILTWMCLSAARWYDERSVTLGADFIARTYRDVTGIIDDP